MKITWKYGSRLQLALFPNDRNCDRNHFKFSRNFTLGYDINKLSSSLPAVFCPVPDSSNTNCLYYCIAFHWTLWTNQCRLFQLQKSMFVLVSFKWIWIWYWMNDERMLITNLFIAWRVYSINGSVCFLRLMWAFMDKQVHSTHWKISFLNVTKIPIQFSLCYGNYWWSLSIYANMGCSIQIALKLYVIRRLLFNIMTIIWWMTHLFYPLVWR